VDAHTGSVPNNDWGQGKLWVGDIVVAAPALDGGAPALAVWPNPAQGSVTIEFGVSRGEDFELQVFDVGGRRIRDLAGGSVASGVGRTSWDGRTGRGRPVPAGVYFVCLRVGEGVREQKVTLLRQ
jgi:hypothetical protein